MWFIQVLINPCSKYLLSPYCGQVLHWELGHLVDECSSCTPKLKKQGRQRKNYFDRQKSVMEIAVDPAYY